MVRALAFLLLALGCSRSSGKAPTPVGDDLAIVLLPAAQLPDPAAVSSAYDAISGGRGTLQVRSGKSDQGLPRFTFGGDSSVVAALMPFPVPNGEAEAAYEDSLSSHLEGDEYLLKPHVAHLIVQFRDVTGRTRRDQLVRFTQVLAALAQASRATGIYWGEAGATHATKLFLDLAADEDPNAMVVLWSGVESVRRGQRVHVLSLGMHQQLGLMDLLVTAPVASADEAILSAYDLLVYETTRGAEVPHGDTVGRNDDENLRVRHETSPVYPDRKVWRVDYP